MSLADFLNEHEYNLKKEVGKGDLSKCYLVESTKYHSPFAAKVYDISEKNSDLSGFKINCYKNERLLLNLQNKNIISVYDLFQNEKYLVIILSYASHGNLLDYGKACAPLIEQDLLKVASQMVSAVFVCHQNGISHLDLQLSSFLLHDNLIVKLADFSNASKLSSQSQPKFSYTPKQYIPPEIYQKMPIDLAKIDIWQLGVSLFFLATGKFPFDDENPDNIERKIIECDYVIETELPSSLLLAINRSLVADPNNRATIMEIKECFQSFETPVKPSSKSLAMARNKIVAKTFSALRASNYHSMNK